MTDAARDSHPVPSQFVDKREMSRLCGLSGDTLKKYRLQGLLIENIHWVRINARVIRYCAPLVLDWIQHANDAAAHARAIAVYQAMQLANQPIRQLDGRPADS
jgi:hypothetical protein